MHLRADLVDGRLRAERGRVGAAVSLHPQAAGAGTGGAGAVTQGAHQAVHVGLLVGLRFTLPEDTPITEFHRENSKHFPNIFKQISVLCTPGSEKSSSLLLLLKAFKSYKMWFDHLLDDLCISKINVLFQNTHKIKIQKLFSY